LSLTPEPAQIGVDRLPADSDADSKAERIAAVGLSLGLDPRLLLSVAAHACVCLALSLSPLPSLAQGGPPLVTDDPDTPGDGHWEINLASVFSRAHVGDTLAVPDADINYGWGPNVQLKLELPWVFERDAGQSVRSGFGAANLGVKWRFVDEDAAGVSVSIYPQYTSSLATSSVTRGLASASHQIFLPVEAATMWGDFDVDAEIGRDLVEGGADEWQGGVVGSHSCGSAVECLAELHDTFLPHDNQILLNLGLRWRMTEACTLLASAGRAFGPRTGTQQQLFMYLGLQLTR
jgi:hypothetical protein